MKYLISAILLAFTLGSPTQAEDMVLENFNLFFIVIFTSYETNL